MIFPWKKNRTVERIAVSWDRACFSYVQTSGSNNSKPKIVKTGVERINGESMQIFIAKLKSLHLSGSEVILQLVSSQYTLLQIDAPPVSDAELKNACAYEIKGLLEGHIDEFSIDVIRLGDGSQKGQGQVFVAAVKKNLIAELTSFCRQIGLDVNIIDIQETAQRNLQTLYSRANGFGVMAMASISVVSEYQALLTISANDELYYFRRLEIPNGFIDEEWGSGFELFQDPYVPVVRDDYSIPTEDFSYDGSYELTNEDERTSKLIVEIQRSLDLWERTWRSLPLVGRVCFCGDRSVDLSGWISQEMNQLVSNFYLDEDFRSIFMLNTKDQILCLPLAGSLLREQKTGAL